MCPTNKKECYLSKIYKGNGTSESPLPGLSSDQVNVTWETTWLVFAVMFCVGMWLKDQLKRDKF